jgi:hypothetical protein
MKKNPCILKCNCLNKKNKNRICPARSIPETAFDIKAGKE